MNRKIKRKTKICIIGTNQYGLSLSKLFSSKTKFSVMVYDENSKIIDELREHNETNIRYESKRSRIFINNLFIITNHNYESAFNDLTTEATPGSIIVFESSISIGETIKFQKLVETKYIVGYSPQRFDPDSITHDLKNIPKLLTSPHKTSLDLIYNVYRKCFNEIIHSTETNNIEAANLLETSYRAVNIGFINEFTTFCERNELNVFDIIDLASSKPFGYMKFFPGLGIGGPFIKKQCEMLTASRDDEWPIMSNAIATLEVKPVNLGNEIINNSYKRILFVGVGYKANSNDWTNTPVTTVIKTIGEKYDIKVSYFDPFIDDYPNAEFVKLPIKNDDFDYIYVIHPYMISYWTNDEFIGKIKFFCRF